jgi:hypothetical protein
VTVGQAGGSWAGGWDEPGVLSVVLINAGTPGSGLFTYSGTPALGNLIESIAGTSGTDPQGNAYLAGETFYGPGPASTRKAVNINASTIQLYTAATAAGPYTAQNAGFFLTANGEVALGNIFGSVPGSPGTQEIWNPMSPLLNSWAAVAGFAAPQYRFIASPANSVEITGAINAAAATTATFFTLPAGYRPASQQPVCSMGANASVPAGLSPWVKCDASGNLSVQNTGALGAWEGFFHGFISLDA